MFWGGCWIRPFTASITRVRLSLCSVTRADRSLPARLPSSRAKMVGIGLRTLAKQIGQHAAHAAKPVHHALHTVESATQRRRRIAEAGDAAENGLGQALDHI